MTQGQATSVLEAVQSPSARKHWLPCWRSACNLKPPAASRLHTSPPLPEQTGSPPGSSSAPATGPSQPARRRTDLSAAREVQVDDPVTALPCGQGLQL
ncbi:hypothetical protein ANANG_G00141710 [Anguilla anguilla]|uniref:Uncharacterized protein n=1 Tax=Anguilla anguilla TaxID=7936 RepID=A0A9D3S091_ANGAN|nr:hypothetical protein ANANG_G00141710 [Anguilla anguilla]